MKTSHGPTKTQTSPAAAPAASCAPQAIIGTAERPRLTVFRSSKHIYAQLIDDLTGVTLAAASSTMAEVRTALPTAATSRRPRRWARSWRRLAKAKGINKAAFDRGHYRYHGRVKALADAAREGGLQF